MSILAKIVEEKRREIGRLPAAKISAARLREALSERGEVRDFEGALKRPLSGGMALIAEVKKASPSAGVICPDFDPIRIARQYELAGASCLSVLTDEKFFQGSLEYLRDIRKAVRVPLLRKDFILDPRQILEAIDWGADAILLIASILSDSELRQLLELGQAAGLGVLVETHDAAEMKRALAAGARLIGVNNRDLSNFKVDLGTTERLSREFANELKGRILVAESGIHVRADVVRLENAGARAILVGESLMRQENIPAKVRELLGIL